MTRDDFLVCKYCRNWGQPWNIGKKKIVCEEKLDISGKAYTPNHPACKYFVPVQGSLPENIQKIRLFVQNLSLTQQSYFAWALSQSSLLLGLKDADGRQLSLGDQVSFRLGLFGHTGTVEGVDIYHKQAIVVNSPAFVNSNISLLSTSLTKISKETAHEIINESYQENKNKVEWHVKSLIDEISILRSKEDSWTKQDYLAVIFYEQQLQNLKECTRYNATMALV